MKKIIKNRNTIWIIMDIILVIMAIILGIFIRINKKEDIPKSEPNQVILKNEEEPVLTVKECVTIHLGEKLDYHSFFTSEIATIPATFKYYKDEEEVKDIIVENVAVKKGTFKVVIEMQDKTYQTTLEVLDKTAPTLEVKDLTITEGENIDVNSFIVGCFDDSEEECIIKLTSANGEETKLDGSVGTRKYIVVASDSSDNETKKEVNLIVKKKEATNSSSNSPKPNSNNTNRKVVRTKNETETTIEPAKYGTNYKVTKTYKVTTYSDGTVDKKLTKTNKVLDTSGFKATSRELEAEARSVANSNFSDYQEMTVYVNQYRSEVGAREITLDKELSVLATIRAIEMAYADKFDHVRPDGRHWGTVGEDMGFSKMIMGENIQYGMGGHGNTPEKAAVNWRNSPGHYRNMIATGFGTIGVGKYTLNGKTYWVQLFCG